MENYELNFALKKLFIYYPYFPLKKLSDKENLQLSEYFFIHSVI